MPNLEGISYSQPESEIRMQEKCGIVGVMVPHDSAPRIARRALIELQHRGQDSAGLTGRNKGKMETISGMGYITSALPDEKMEVVGDSNVAIAHNRYATAGSISGENSQPVQDFNGDFTLSLAHNGNLINTDWLIEQLGDINLPEGVSDTVLLSKYLLKQRPLYPSWQATFQQELANIEGAYSAVAMTEDGSLHGFRDPRGIRPFVVGNFPDGGIILASETVALDQVGAEYRRQVSKGEILTITPDGVEQSVFFSEPKEDRFCTFENFYFARPESYINDGRILEGRLESGRRLADRAQEKGIEVEQVVPIKESGFYAGEGFSDRSGLKITHAVGTNRFADRSFMQSSKEKRDKAALGKHTVIPNGYDDVSLAVVDDSLVRGTTMAALGNRLVNNGASKVHVFSASPPIVEKCDLGVDMKDKSELAAAAVSDQPLEKIEDYMAERTGANSVTFLSRTDMAESFGRKDSEQCTFCLGGEHPIRGKQEQFPQKERPIEGKPKLAVFISGNGTNLQEIINRVKNDSIDAKISHVVTNNADAYGRVRAEEAGIPTSVVPSKGRLKDSEKRAQYEQELLKAITADEDNLPDALVLAGFKTVLGDEFLTAMQKLQIPVLNLHPGLLTAKDGGQVATSKGLMPVFRGTDAIGEAYDSNVRASGVTVHQLLPGNEFDTGPIVLKEEVHKRVGGETREEWASRIHEAEYRVLPAAINRVLHTMKHGIDVSKGGFPW